MAQQNFWHRTKKGGKLSFDKLYTLVDKLGAPVNKLSNKLGSEAFWPTTLDKESDKAARILRSFCKDGFYQEQERPSADAPTAKQRVVKKIPPQVIRNAKGLAIFTTMRSGLWVSGAGGSGVILARLPDGTWSPPSGIILHTAGLGFLAGIDIYDCVLVINTDQAMQAFKRLRCTVGGEISAVAGPVGAGAILETELHKRQAPIFTYLKSRGFYAGVQVDGTVMLERSDENERFYLQKLSAQEILTGKVQHPPYELRNLIETVKAAQGDADYDESILPQEPPPSDYEIDDETNMFGIPSKDDPDPYGVLQLEKEGMLIREAGTHKRASWEQFAFKPSPTSPVFDAFENRQSKDRDSINSRISAAGSRANNAVTDVSGRESRASSRVTMADSSTQTDDLPPPNSPGRSSLKSSTHRSSMEEVPESAAVPSTTSIHLQPRSHEVKSPSSLSRVSSPALEPTAVVRDESDDEEVGSETASDDDSTEEVVEDEWPVIVHNVQQATAPQVTTKARLVTVPKRIPPTLPVRNPHRQRPDTIKVMSTEEPPQATTPTLEPLASSSNHESGADDLTQLNPEDMTVNDDNDEDGDAGATIADATGSSNAASPSEHVADHSRVPVTPEG